MPDIPPHLGFIQADCAHTVARRPEIKPLGIPPSFDEIPVDPHRRLPFQPPYRVRHAQFWRNAQTHVDMVGHRMPFHQLHSKLSTEILELWRVQRRIYSPRQPQSPRNGRASWDRTGKAGGLQYGVSYRPPIQL